MSSVLKYSELSVVKLDVQSTDVNLKNDTRICLPQSRFVVHDKKSKQGSISASVGQSNKKLLPYVLIVITLCLISLLFKLTFPYPLHASCLVKWIFKEKCTFTIQRLKSQIIKWSKNEHCRSKCLYKLAEFMNNNTIKALRVSTKHNIVDYINIILIDLPENICTVFAQSSASNWFTVFDGARNYCNLHNLIVEAGYDNNYNFSEFTTSLLCTQYEMSYCD